MARKLTKQGAKIIKIHSHVLLHVEIWLKSFYKKHFVQKTVKFVPACFKHDDPSGPAETFRQLWTDRRLAGKLNRTFTIKESDNDHIWVPDSFCYNARESNLMLPNEEVHSLVYIQPAQW